MWLLVDGDLAFAKEFRQMLLRISVFAQACTPNELLTYTEKLAPSAVLILRPHLIENGADINKETYYKHTPLSILTLRYDGREEGYNLFLYLLEKGAKIDAGYKGHAIFGACSNINSFPMAKYLFENYEIDVNMRSRLISQHTLLMETVPPHGCSPVMCQYLLDKGADKTLKDANGKTAYDLAVERQEFLLNKGYGEENEYLVEVNTLVELLK